MQAEPYMAGAGLAAAAATAAATRPSRRAAHRAVLIGRPAGSVEWQDGVKDRHMYLGSVQACEAGGARTACAALCRRDLPLAPGTPGWPAVKPWPPATI